MATKPKTNAGTMACLCCGHDIPVKAAENGTLNVSCAWCDFTAYAKVGTEAHRTVTGKLKNKPAPAPEPAPVPAKPAPAKKPTPAPEPAPAKQATPPTTEAPKRPMSIFHMG